MLVYLLYQMPLTRGVVYGRAIGSVRADDGYGAGGRFKGGSFGQKVLRDEIDFNSNNLTIGCRFTSLLVDWADTSTCTPDALRIGRLIPIVR